MALADTNSWTTSIAEVQDRDVVVRGEKLTELIGHTTFAEMAYLVLTGEKATPGQARVLEAMLVSAVEHGVSPSSMVSRLMASYGVPIQVGLASGALTMGDHHGGAGEATARGFQELIASLDPGARDESAIRAAATDFVTARRASGSPVEGFGHPQHERDPRVAILLALAKEEGVSGVYCVLLEQIESALEHLVGRPIPANFDGVSAALLLDLGLDWRVARPLIISARTVGLAAHFLEEVNQGNRWRHVPLDQVTYTGRRPDS
jgi:citrate synthase